MAFVANDIAPSPLGSRNGRPFGLLPYWKGASRILFPITLVLALLGARWNARRWCVML